MEKERGFGMTSDLMLEHFEDEGEFERCLNLADAATCLQRESDFVDDLRAKYEEYGTRMFLSVKQADWLKRIAGWED
jgi:hypothetical protein